MHDIISILKFKDEQALEVLHFLETQGYIEKSGIEGYWQHCVSGDILANKSVPRIYKVETLQKHLTTFLKRVKTINRSKKYPDRVNCIKITSEYPINNKSLGIEIAFSLVRKNLSNKEDRLIVENLIKEYRGRLNTIIESISYSQTAVESVLKSGSHALKLTKYEQVDIENIEGYKIFGKSKTNKK